MAQHPQLGSESTFNDFSCFQGLPSHPVCIYYTAPPWSTSDSPDAGRQPREVRPIRNGHPLVTAWSKLGQQVYKYLDSVGVKWTSIDPVCFAEGEKQASSPFIWVGVVPRSLAPDKARDAAAHCKQILAESQITDVEIAFRESIVTRWGSGVQ